MGAIHVSYLISFSFVSFAPLVTVNLAIDCYIWLGLRPPLRLRHSTTLITLYVGWG
ncbi:hypothetical protein BDZ91DRAFT_725391 [Kalaharituber pfeilii]|nr:hypothetical protein BDZ91DRAFT_725391 [Kalaharituber pfeilii]